MKKKRERYANNKDSLTPYKRRKQRAVPPLPVAGKRNVRSIWSIHKTQVFFASFLLNIKKRGKHQWEIPKTYTLPNAL